MKDLELLIQYLYYNYKDIFPNRNAILHHLFFVLGNGYDWHKEGYLIEEYEEELKKPPKKLIIPTGELLFIYPLCGLSHIANIPDNIIPNWLNGIKEAIHDVKKILSKEKHTVAILTEVKGTLVLKIWISFVEKRIKDLETKMEISK